MKTVRFVTMFLALAIFVTALVPFAASPVSAQTRTFAAAAPVQAFLDAALGLPLLSPMSISAIPVFTISIESAAAGSDYACSLVSQKPKDWTKMQRRQIFDAIWTVRNSGKKNWGTTSIDFKYISGTKMYTYADAYDLWSSVGPGKKIELIVDMISPKTKGYFTTKWGLYKGSKAFCKLSLTINVNR
jgi:hypothetical protein